MSNYAHQTTPTQFVEAAGIRLAYRRFANRRSGAKIDIPLLFFMHFTGTMDHWDPALTDGFAQDREVILFNNAGISSSSSEVPTSIEEMAQHAAAFTDALGIKKLDALGFSMGGFIAQQFTIDRPDLVRKLILVGTGPRSGEGMASLTPRSTGDLWSLVRSSRRVPLTDQEMAWIRGALTSLVRNSLVSLLRLSLLRELCLSKVICEMRRPTQ